MTFVDSPKRPIYRCSPLALSNLPNTVGLDGAQLGEAISHGGEGVLLGALVESHANRLRAPYPDGRDQA